MSVLGMAINVLAVIVAGNAGALFRGKLRTRYQEIVLLACGLILGVAGLWGAMRSLFIFSDKKLEIEGSLLVLVSLLIGTLLGSSFDVEGLLDRLGGAFRRAGQAVAGASDAKSKTDVKARADARARVTAGVGTTETGDGTAAPEAEAEEKQRRRLEDLPVYNLPSARSGHRFVDGFVIATLLLCLNPFTLEAAQQAGLTGSPTMFYYVSILDFCLVAALATVYGVGVSYAAVPLLVVEGVTMLLCRLKNSYMEGGFGRIHVSDTQRQRTVDSLLNTFWGETFPTMQSQFCVIAGVILFALGLNLALGKKIKVANMAPALLIPLLYYGVTLLVQLIP